LGAGGVGPVYLLSQWSSFLIPFVFVGTIYGLKRIQLWVLPIFGSLQIRKLVVLMLILTTLTAGFTSGLSLIGPSTHFSLGDNSVPTDIQQGSLIHAIWPTPVNDSAILDRFVLQIPGNYSVMTQNQIGSKLGERLAPIFIFYQPGYKDPNADAILVDYQLAGFCAGALCVLPQ